MKTRSSRLILSLLFLASACSSTRPTRKIIVDPGSPDSAVESELLSALPGPPATGSIEDTADWNTLKNYQKTRTPEDCKRASTEAGSSLVHFFGPPYGPLSHQELAQVSPLFEKIGKLTYEPNFISAAKKHWERVRPFVLHSDLNPCVKKEASSSYPSMHAALSRIYAHELSEIYPDKKDRLLKRADQIAEDRVIAGLHNPSDIRDGKLLGDKNYEYLKSKPEYRKEMEAFLQAQKH